MQFSTGDIVIDEHFARFGSKSYALDKINTVDVRSRRVGGIGWVFWALFTVICVLLTIAAAGKDGVGGAILPGLFTVLFGWLTMRGHGKANRLWHQLFLTTSNGDAQAMQSMDLAEVMKLREALEGAIAARRS